MALSPQVRLIARFLWAQALIAVVTGLPFSRRQLSAVFGTLVFAVVVIVFAVLARTGTPVARTVVLSFELTVLLYGLYRFFFVHRYLAGTVFALVSTVALLHPAVARAYGPVSGVQRHVDHRDVDMSGRRVSEPLAGSGQASPGNLDVQG